MDIGNSRKPCTAGRRRAKRKGSGAIITAFAIFIGITGTIFLFGSKVMNVKEPVTVAETVRTNSQPDSPIRKKIQALENADRASDSTHAIDTTPKTDSTPAADVDAMPSNISDRPWNLVLVNASNPTPKGHNPPLVEVGNGYRFDERAAEQLKAMLSAAKAEGLSPIICSAYRSVEKQQQLYDGQLIQQINLGFPKADAEQRARSIVAYPGTSEHNLGLAVDIVSLHNQLLDDSQAETAEAKWLAKNCSEYGFILRYPKDKDDITGIIYEPWHFRYVGKEAAKEIMEQGICLEEYLAV